MLMIKSEVLRFIDSCPCPENTSLVYELYPGLISRIRSYLWKEVVLPSKLRIYVKTGVLFFHRRCVWPRRDTVHGECNALQQWGAKAYDFIYSLIHRRRVQIDCLFRLWRCPLIGPGGCAAGRIFRRFSQGCLRIDSRLWARPPRRAPTWAWGSRGDRRMLVLGDHWVLHMLLRSVRNGNGLFFVLLLRTVGAT